MTLAEKPAKAETSRTGVTRSTLIEQLGEGPGQEFFSRIDGAQRKGEVVVGSNVREARIGFSKVNVRHAQLVIPGRGGGSAARRATDLADGVVIMKMEDLEAVVKAGQKSFDWAAEFAPRSGLEAAIRTPNLKPGSRGRRTLRA